MFDFLKAILVGICASAPLGPVCALVIQKTVTHGRRAGFVTGLGSSLADTMFAAVAVFAVAAVQKFIEDNNTALSIIGGAIVIMIGLSMIFRKQMERKGRTGQVSARFSAQAFLMALSNPGALAMMFAMMLLFGVDGSCDKLVTICGVATGSVIWWTFVAFVIDKVGHNLNVRNMLLLNRVVGIFVMAFGAWMTVRGIINL